MLHRRGLNRVSGANRRRTGWEEGVGGSAITTLTASGSSVLGSALAIGTDGVTMIRTRGFLEMFLTAATTAGDGFTGAIGIGKSTTQAFAVGITALPVPVTDADWDGWLYHQFFSVHSASALQAFTTPSSVIRMPVESKGMRKAGLDDVFFAVIEVTEIGVSSLSVFFDTRMLFKLP